MRIYQDFNEVKSEVSRDLKELSVVYQSHNVQDKDVSQDPGYLTHELMGYSYTLATPNTSLITLPEAQWDYIDDEFMERTDTVAHNPGVAWRQDADYWSEFMDSHGQFSYTYSERMTPRNAEIIALLDADPNTRQAWLPIWQPKDNVVIEMALKGERHPNRVPCSLGYHLMIRNGELHLHYVMRSCDFAKHFHKDVALACQYMAWIQNQLKVRPKLGYFTHTIFSLHAFAKDLEGVF